MPLTNVGVSKSPLRVTLWLTPLFWINVNIVGSYGDSGNENAGWRPLHQKPQPEVDLSSFSMVWVDNVIMFPAQFSWHEQAQIEHTNPWKYFLLCRWMLEWVNYGGGVWLLFGIGAVRDDLTASLIKTVYLNR